MPTTTGIRTTLAVVLTVLLAACAPGGTRGGSPEEPLDTTAIDGNLRLYLVDAPADYDEVWVSVTRVEIGLGTDGDTAWVTITDTPRQLDLLTLRDGVSAILGDATLAPGAYGQLRFVVDRAWVVKDGAEQPLTIPSATRTGIKVNLDVTIEPAKTYALVLDFDALESIKSTGAGLQLKPVIRAVYSGVVADDAGQPDAGAPPSDAGE